MPDSPDPLGRLIDLRDRLAALPPYHGSPAIFGLSPLGVSDIIRDGIKALDDRHAEVIGRLKVDNDRYKRALWGVVNNAIRNGAAMRMHRSPAWAIVNELTANGSTVSHALCREFGVDPDEEVYLDPEPDESEDDDV